MRGWAAALSTNSRTPYLARFYRAIQKPISQRFQRGYNLLMRKLWFKSKTFGWRWTPATWEGWVIVIGYAGVIALAAFVFLHNKPVYPRRAGG